MKSAWFEFKADTANGNTRVNLVAGKVLELNIKGDSFFVKAKADNTDVHSSGWTFMKGNEKIFEILEKAKNENIYLLLRFEKQRKENVPKEIDISVLTKDINEGKKNVFNNFTALYDVNNKSWIRVNTNLSDPSKDPGEVANWIEDILISEGKESIDTESFFSHPKETDENTSFVNKEISNLDIMTEMFQYIELDGIEIEKVLPILVKIPNFLDNIQKKIFGFVNRKDNTYINIFNTFKFVTKQNKFDEDNTSNWIKNITLKTIQIIENLTIK